MTTATQMARIGNFMSVDPIVIDSDATAAEAERLMKTYHVTGLPVIHEGHLAGVISQSDIIVARSSEMIGPHWDRVRVRHLMTSPAVTIHTTATVRHAAALMLEREIHRLVVVDDEGQPIGVVTTLDLLRSLTEPTVTPAA
ncbi:MAG TPA: CBS domain-containing protein [Candidatus Limnocylindria bacterium]|nr:CBS domain-containing protein [Candidatus Limnocylindria bacterium]